MYILPWLSFAPSQCLNMSKYISLMAPSLILLTELRYCAVTLLTSSIPSAFLHYKDTTLKGSNQVLNDMFNKFNTVFRREMCAQFLTNLE